MDLARDTARKHTSRALAHGSARFVAHFSMARDPKYEPYLQFLIFFWKQVT